MLQVNKDNFTQEVLQSPIPVVVDFFATWCGPCRMIAPVLDSVSEDYAGKVKFVRLDVDEATEISIQYGVMSIPTLIMFQNGQEIDKTIGAIGAEELTDWIDGNI